MNRVITIFGVLPGLFIMGPVLTMPPVAWMVAGGAMIFGMGI